jgi:hypothetical protein
VPNRQFEPAVMMVASFMMLSTDLPYDNRNQRAVG